MRSSTLGRHGQGVPRHAYAELFGLLDTAASKVKAIVVGAIGNMAHASGNTLMPHFGATIRRLAQSLQLSNKGEDIKLCDITAGAIGTYAAVVNNDVFRLYVQDMAAQAFAAIELLSLRLLLSP